MYSEARKIEFIFSKLTDILDAPVSTTIRCTTVSAAASFVPTQFQELPAKLYTSWRGPCFIETCEQQGRG